jgi:O-antigen/teichoic acid export membrane protein
MALVAFAGSILLGRILGPKGYGSFYFLMAIVLFIHNPVDGWGEACRKRLTESEFPSSDAIGATLLGIGIGTVIMFLGALIFSPVIASYTGNPSSWIYLIVLFVGTIFFSTSLHVLQATENFGTSTWIEAIRDIIRVLLQGALVISGFGIAGMIGGITAANLLVVPIVFYLIKVRPTIPSRESLVDIWSFARSSVPSGLVGIAQNRMDILLLGFIVGAESVGNYEIALKMTMPAMFVAGVAQNGLMGRISELQSKGKPIHKDIQNNLAYASIIGIPLFFGALTMSKPVVVTIYSNQFSGSATFLIGLSFFRLVRTQKSILVASINGLDLPEINLQVSTIVFTANITLGLVLLFKIGPIGVVIATIISELLAYGIRGYLVKQSVPSVSLINRMMIDQLVSGIFMMLVVYIVRRILPMSSWQAVVLTVGIGAIVYFTTLFAISNRLRIDFKNIIQN